jgi:hypothetical protein
MSRRYCLVADGATDDHRESKGKGTSSNSSTVVYPDCMQGRKASRPRERERKEERQILNKDKIARISELGGCLGKSPKTDSAWC